jgi:hypothetical protein
MAQSGKFGLKKFVKTSGSLGIFDIITDTKVQIIVENAGPVNTVALYGKIQGQNSYVLVDTVIGSSGKVIEVGLYDFLELEVLAYDSLGTYIDIAGSGFYTTAGGGSVPTSISVNNFPASQNVVVTNPVSTTAIVRASDGTPITHTTAGTKEALDVNAIAPELSLRFDEVSATLYYLAEGTFGALDSEPKWKIKKIEITGSFVSIKNSSENFDQIWNNRASLTYV